jgi:heat shock protein HtpX
LIMSAVMGFAGSIISLFLSKWSAKRMVGAQVISNPIDPTERWLMETVRKQAQAVGIGMPEVAIYEAPDVNAFATGWNRNNALVAVSTGLLHNMSRDEAEAVVAHEISHVANGDMITLALIQGVVNTFVIFFSRIIGHLVDHLVFKTEREYGPAYWITTIIAQMVLGILASIIVMWFSRQREFRADAGGANLAGRNKMIAALEKLKINHEQVTLPERMAAFGIAGGGGLAKLFSTHPSLDERIETLRAVR